jgi:hypothetical protein
MLNAIWTLLKLDVRRLVKSWLHRDQKANY